MSYSSIWSPAAIAPVSDLMSSNSCMQRAAYHHHQMASNAPPTGACYPSQGYGPASAYHYGNMDYHAMSAMPSMSHHSQLGSMSQAALNQMAGQQMSAHMNPMGGHGLHSGAHVTGHQSRSSPLNGSLASAPNDCDYSVDKASWKFQVL